MSIIQDFLSQLPAQADKPALILDDQVVTYQQLAQQVSAVSAGLIDAGVKPNDHIGVLLPNGIEFAVLMMVAANIGAVLVPQSMSLVSEALSRAIDASDIRHFVVWHALIPDLEVLKKKHCEEGSVWLTVGGELDSEYSEYLAYSNLLNHAPDQLIGKHDFSPEQAFILTMTSGSTGDPKPIVLSQAVKYARAQAAIQLYGISHDDVVLIATPMYHSLAQRLLFMPLMLGGTCVIMAGYTAQKWISAVKDAGVSFSIIVSSQLKQIISVLEQRGETMNTLRCLVSSSERLPDTVRDSVLRLMKCDFHECYGASEIAIATNLDYQKKMVSSVGHAIKSVGQAINSVDVRIIDNDGVFLKAGEAGEIVCKTPMLFSGYYKKPHETAASMIGQYFCTGDLGKLDELGYLSFLGRKKDIIITGGINVYPKDIEDVISKHPGVSQCSVIPIEDEFLGEQITAIVVPAVGQSVSIRELQKRCINALADYQQPRQYFIESDLPKNAMGKVMKRKLIEKYQSKINV